MKKVKIVFYIFAIALAGIVYNAKDILFNDKKLSPSLEADFTPASAPKVNKKSWASD